MSHPSADELGHMLGSDGAIDPVEERSALSDVHRRLFGARHVTFTPLRVGRYVLLERIGGGGHGTVYRAYDPELRRPVAVKVIPPADGERDVPARERLLREAQAIARLEHPNVVSVYDVGIVPDDSAVLAPGSVYMVLELVDGLDLRRWLDVAPRSVRDIVEVFVRVGRGLTAAHDSNLVHRDLKPANILVGTDGRVRVADFGLARALNAPIEIPSTTRVRSPVLETGEKWLDRSITQDGFVVGTPAFMAPEQQIGEMVDERSDQYAFAVAMWIALFGERPFSGGSPSEVLRQKLRGAPSAPAAAVPRRLVEILQRAMCPDAAQRWPTMRAMVDAIERHPRTSRRRLWSGAVLALAGTLGLFAALWPRPVDPVCRDPERTLDGSWNPPTMVQLREQLSAVDPNLGPDAARVTLARLDTWADAWRRMRVSTCDQRRLGAVRPEVAAARLACLDGQRAEFEELLAVLADADAAVVRNAAFASARLPVPRRCADARRLDAPGDEGRSLDDLDRRMARAAIHFDAGLYAALVDTCEGLAADARGAARPRIEAQAELLACRVHWRTDRPDLGRDHCRAALAASERVGDDDLVVRALSEWTRVETALNHLDAAIAMYEVAVRRHEGLTPERRDPLTFAHLAMTLGTLSMERGELERAEAAHRRALEAYTRALGAEHPDLVAAHNGLGLALSSSQRFEAARREYALALDLTIDTLGPHHPHVGALRNNLATADLRSGRLDDALEGYEAALAAKRRSHGAASPRLLTSTYMKGRTLTRLGRHDDAIETQHEGLRIARATYGAGDPLTVSNMAFLGESLGAAGRCEEALVVLMEAWEISAGAGGDPTNDGHVALEIGRCEDDLGRPAIAGVWFERAVSITSKRRSRDDFVIAEALLELGRWQLRHHRDDASATLRRGLDAVANSEADALLIASLERSLADALARSGDHDAADDLRASARARAGDRAVEERTHRVH